VESLREHRFSHFVCHGKLEYGRPSDASFGLHDSMCLTLLDLIQPQLPFAELALLSACRTAARTEGSIADEALHLTVVMRYCGFRSVVGTMWGMADADGSELVEDFYKSMFSGEETGTCETPYYERSARAHRDAALQLRRKPGLPPERWAHFVHDSFVFIGKWLSSFGEALALAMSPQRRRTLQARAHLPQFQFSHTQSWGWYDYFSHHRSCFFVSF